MDKQMIAKMEKDIAVRMAMAKGVAGSMNNGVEGWLAEYLIEKGWAKIPEGAVVLTKEEHKSLIYWEGRFDELIKLATETARKETAEKFAKRLNAKLNEWLQDNEDNDGKIDFGIAQIELIGVKSLEGEVIAESLIDEICKEITEDKNDGK